MSLHVLQRPRLFWSVVHHASDSLTAAEAPSVELAYASLVPGYDWEFLQKSTRSKPTRPEHLDAVLLKVLGEDTDAAEE